MKYKKYIIIFLCALSLNSAIYSAGSPAQANSSARIANNSTMMTYHDCNETMRLNPNYSGNNRQYDWENSVTNNFKTLGGAGVGRAISNGIEKSISELIYVVPNTIKFLYTAFTVRAAKIVTGSLGVTSKSVLILSNDINTKFNQFCFTKAAMQDRIKRAADIAIVTDENAVDVHWQTTQKYLNMSLDTACNYLKANIGSYDKTHEFVSFNPKLKKRSVTMWRRLLISLMHKFSIKNDDVIFNYMKQSIFDIESLKNYINSCKSYKDVENNADHIKKWVNALCGDLNSIASELDGEIGKINIAMKSPSNASMGGNRLAADLGI